MNLESTCVRTETDDVIRRWVDKAAQEDHDQRRKSLRFPLFRAAYITQPDQEMQAWCRDISPRGIGLLHPKPLALGKTAISVCQHNKRVDAAVDVVWNKPAGGSWWLSGGRFSTSSVNYASLFLSTVSDEMERRRHKRHPFFRQLVISKFTGQGRELFECETFSLEVSSGGLSLLADQCLDKGEYRLQTTGGDRTLDIRGQVVSCRELLNGSFQIGIAFKRLEITSLLTHC